MCFRPADVSAGVDCPKCGKKVNSTQGVLPKKCPFCKFELTEEAAAALLGTPNAPVAPGAPTAPSMPGAPKMPGAPAAPSIPGAPKPPTA